MSWRDQDPTILRMLTEFDHLTVVGLSRDPAKSAHAIPARMQRFGYRVTPVHPSADVLLGERVYRSVREVPDPQIVQVFRPADEAPGIARDAVAAGAKAVWLQLGLISGEARQICEDAGLLYVDDHCMAVDYIRLGLTAA